MIRRLPKLILALLAFLIVPVTLWYGFTVPRAQAQDCADDGLPPDPPTVDSVQPDNILNTAATTITVFGTNFDSTSVVILEGFGSLQTTYVSATVLTAVVPAGVPNSRYDVEVLRQDGECGVLNNGLRVRAVTTPVPTGTPAPTATPQPTTFIRPLVTVVSYAPSTNPPLYPGQEFDFAITLQNTGQLDAISVVVEFPTGDVLPRDTGGTRTIGDLAPGQITSFSQPLRVDSGLNGYEAAITLNISYTDPYGKSYTESNVLSFEAGQYANTPTPLPTLSVRPNIIIDSHTTDPSQLAPGSTAKLTLDLVNAGPETARQITVQMSFPDTTQTVLASLTSSERYIDQLEPGSRTSIEYEVSISGDAEAGLVAVQFDLSYIDNYNIEQTDVETLSLRIDEVPMLYISFFQDLPDPIMVGDNIDLPIQVVNVGPHTLNVTTVEVTGERVEVSDGTTFLGTLDSGTSGSLTATGQAAQAGTGVVHVNVHYLDAFNQPRVYTQDLTFQIEASPVNPEQPGNGGAGSGPQGFGPGATQEMTLLDRLVRGILGFFGLAVRNQGTAGGFPPVTETPTPEGTDEEIT